MRLPTYQVETPYEQWGFSTLYALNVWIKEKNVDASTITVYVTQQLTEEEWKLNVE